jgi:hypothetical protein
MPRTAHPPSARQFALEEVHEDKDMKAGERREVVDRASQKGLPRIRCNKTTHGEQPNPWPKMHTGRCRTSVRVYSFNLKLIRRSILID